ncbi:MAG: hypothetical protein K8823_377 [Cenarchaeum symbiont of Oopsacas minuta]|nr:hypothetical protein [Cenarchaeum symbiont of Oopsacas minuta]
MVLDETVARTKFNIAKCEINEQSNQENDWQLRIANFPNIFIDIFALDNNVSLTLYLNMSNWDFQPPSATLLHPTLNRLSKKEEVPAELELGHPHIFQNPRIWFCSPGFFEYHQHYKLDRWELIRNTSEGTITWIINRAISLIDRSKLCGYNV